LSINTGTHIRSEPHDRTTLPASRRRRPRRRRAKVFSLLLGIHQPAISRSDQSRRFGRKATSGNCEDLAIGLACEVCIYAVAHVARPRRLV